VKATSSSFERSRNRAVITFSFVILDRNFQSFDQMDFSSKTKKKKEEEEETNKRRIS